MRNSENSLKQTLEKELGSLLLLSRVVGSYTEGIGEQGIVADSVDSGISLEVD